MISTFNAHQKGYQENRPHPAAKKVLSLCQNDMIAVERKGGPREIMRVVKFTQNGQITLVQHHEAGRLADRNKSTDDPLQLISPTPSGLKAMKARQQQQQAYAAQTATETAPAVSAPAPAPTARSRW